ncbi:Transmembrane protein 147 [Clonorchis sinensis]|uniref:BOS complex subunit TMEM147 n=1 Tax=Clonorchis sinensis TaxID=79923 RepID=A0A3R7GR62_CLOSI|nr:Transmembrane protein 147 [Clonorchis sinensis]
MGLFHLANCLLLATGPYFLVYKVSGMRENDAFWKCCKMIVLYGITQLTRFFLATLVPHHLELTVQNNFLFFDVPGALIELVVVYFNVRRASSRSEFSILASSIGWATASLLSTKYIPIWFGTKGLEFDWRYICLSYQANLEMVICLFRVYRLDHYILPFLQSVDNCKETRACGMLLCWIPHHLCRLFPPFHIWVSSE